MGGGQEIDGQCDNIDGQGWIYGPSQIYIQQYNQNRASGYFVTGEDE